MPTAPAKGAIWTATALAYVPLLGPLDWRVSALALAGAVATLWVPAAARGSLAVLVATAARTADAHPWHLAPLALIALPCAALWTLRPGWTRAGLLLGTLAAVGLASRDPATVAIAAAALGVFLAPLESIPAPRTALAAALLGAAAVGAYGPAHAYVGLRRARAQNTLRTWWEAEDRCRAAHWKACVEESLVQQGQLWSSMHRLDRAVEAVQRVPFPPAPSTQLHLADLEEQDGRDPWARDRLHKLAWSDPQARAPLSPATAALWGRALLRTGHADLAAAAVKGVSGDDAQRVRTLAARAQGHAEAPSRGMSFQSAVRLDGVTAPTACVPRGGRIELTWSWTVQGGFSPQENLWIFVHADGPGRTLGFDHLLGGRSTSSFAPGEVVRDPVEGAIPPDAPSGRYAIRLGLYDPATGLRLHPDGLPGHITFADAGAFEVCP